MYEVSKQFVFEAAHTLHREIEAEASRRIHGHSYRVVVTIAGEVDPDTGMVLDLGKLDRSLQEIRAGLDHAFLDDIPDLGTGTIENISAWIWRRLIDAYPGIARVTVSRDTVGDSCTYFGPGPAG